MSAPQLDAGLARRLTAQVAERLAASPGPDGQALTGDDQRSWAHKLIADALGDEAARLIRAGQPVLDPEREQALAQAVHDQLFGLGRLQRYLDDATVTDIVANGCDRVLLTRTDHSKTPGEPIADSDSDLVELIRVAAARMGRSERRFDSANPELSLQLPDGSRLHAVMGVAGRPCVTIRRHQFDLAFLSDLADRGMFTPAVQAFLQAAVRARKNLVIAGGIGVGKTTLLRALINEIPPHERLITIEDNLELGSDRFDRLHPDIVTLEARPANVEGHGAVNLETLVRMALRMNPDRVLVGEVRGAEMLPMLLAMTQGKDGSMCTIHAPSARQVFDRFVEYGLLPPHRLPVEATTHLVAGAVDLVVHIGGDRRSHNGPRRRRHITAVLEVRHAQGQQVVTNEVFVPGPDGHAVPAPGVPISAPLLADLQDAGLDRGLLAGSQP